MPDPSPENEAANAAAATENEATNVVASSSPAGTASTAENEEKPKLFENVTHYFRLLVYAQPTSLDITLLVGGFVCAIASGIPFPLLGIIFGQLIDDLNSATCASDSSQDASYQSDVDGKILYVVYLAIAQFGFMYIHLSCWSLGGARLAQRLREQYLRSLLRQEPSFFDKLPGGEVSSRLNSDIQNIRNGTSEKVGICISSVSFFVTAYVVAFVKDATLAGILVSLVPAYMAMSWVGNYFIERFAGRMSDHVAAAAAIASEGLSNVLVVHAFSANARLEEKFAADLRSSQHEGIKKAVASGVQSGLMYFIAYAANALAFWEGSRIIAAAVGRDSAGATVGTIFTVIFILVDATLVLSQVAPYLQVFGAASAAFTKLRRDMDAVSAIDGTAATGSRVPAAAGRVELRAVTFAYPSRPAAPVLRDVSLVAAAGAHTAIVGLSGSGKSTIAGLVSRLYDPDGGRVLLDGADLRALNTRDVRAHVSLVQQDALLLDRSILENVAHGLVNSPDPQHAALREKLLGPQLALVAEAVRDGADAVEAAQKQGPEMVEVVKLVQRAAEQADAANFIAGLKGGLGTRVGPGGRLLSGGQKQRVALARALVKNPKILILDEATASLDSRSEQAILAAIERVSEGRTMISIAHRLSTIKNADKIIVLRDGVVLEEGGHAELMAKEGAYFDLVRLQNTSPDSAHSKTSSTAGSVTDLSDAASIEKASGPGAERGTAEVTNEKSEASAAETPAADDEEGAATSTERSLGNIIAETCRMARPHILVVLLALLGATIVGGAFSAEAVIFGNTVQSLNPCKSEESIRWHGRFFGLMFFVLAIIEFFANLVSWSGFGYVAEKIMYRVRVLSFRSLFEQDLQWHQSEGRTPSSLLSIITNDGNLLGGLSGSIIGTIFSIIVNLVAAVILTHVVAWRIALVCLAIVPLLLGVGIQQLRVLAQFEERHENAYAESVGIGVEAANSIKAIASLSLEHETLEVYRRSLKGPKEETTLVSLHASLWLAAAYFIGNLGYALAYWWGSKQIIGGYHSQAQFLIVVFSLLVSAQLWSQMFALAPEVSSARAAIARILNIIELNPDQKLSGSRPLPDAGAASEKEKDVEASAESSPRSGSGGVGIAFRDVKFAYPARPNAPVLHGMDLEIRPGQFAAFVGPSGAGKSTIISLVERMYVPSSGSILLDGADITQRSDTRFRDDMALVPQESVLFGGSIRFNMALGARPGHTATDAEIEEACRLANIHDTIAGLPQGYDTLCGPNGSQLSGGQKQRLAIARALVRRPRLLILDESTSALDAESEKLLQDGLARAARGITVLAIAHRLHTIRKADVIFLIEAGRCVDRGTHDELFERSESYRTNVLHQTSGV